MQSMKFIMLFKVWKCNNYYVPKLLFFKFQYFTAIYLISERIVRLRQRWNILLLMCTTPRCTVVCRTLRVRKGSRELYVRMSLDFPLPVEQARELVHTSQPCQVAFLLLQSTHTHSCLNIQMSTKSGCCGEEKTRWHICPYMSPWHVLPKKRILPFMKAYQKNVVIWDNIGKNIQAFFWLCDFFFYFLVNIIHMCTIYLNLGAEILF